MVINLIYVRVTLYGDDTKATATTTQSNALGHPLTLTLDVQQNIGKLECKVIICVNVQAAGRFTNTE